MLTAAACTDGAGRADTGGGAASESPSSPPSASAPARSEFAPPIDLYVVGDSNTAGFSGTLERGLANGSAWVSTVLDDVEGIRLAGGWANDGATSTRMADSLVPPEDDVDVLVIMAGTNNLALGMEGRALQADLARIDAQVGAPVTLILAVAPFDARPADALALNEELRGLAEFAGWDFFDPWIELRDADGRWLAEYRREGLHTTPAGYEVVGHAIADEIQQRYGE